MNFESVILPSLSLLIGFFSFAFTVYHTQKTAAKQQQDTEITQAQNHQKILSRLDMLASKDFLDVRLKEEMGDLEGRLKTQINALRIDMKEQINEVKHDIKFQQETTGTMAKDVVKASESAQNAHERIEATNKRLDDLKDLFMVINKKA